MTTERSHGVDEYYTSFLWHFFGPIEQGCCRIYAHSVLSTTIWGLDSFCKMTSIVALAFWKQAKQGRARIHELWVLILKSKFARNLTQKSQPIYVGIPQINSNVLHIWMSKNWLSLCDPGDWIFSYKIRLKGRLFKHYFRKTLVIKICRSLPYYK